MSEELKEYFKTIYKDVDSKIVFDDDQINAITNDNDYVLVLAGAGTGKTTTMVGKVKYLVDIKKVDPSRILVISYTKKAVEELQDLINNKFGINAYVTTFHSLAYKFVRNIFKNRKCIVVDYNLKEKIFYDYMNNLFKDKKIEELLETFTPETTGDNSFFIGKYFLDNYQKYEDYDALFNDYKKYRIEEAKNIGIKLVIKDWVEKWLTNDDFVVTIKGEVVKSAAEAKIANFLFTHGIDYEYEKIYSKIVEDNKVYKPDFTLNLAGQDVYLEYFGLDDERYNSNKEKKIEMHKQHNNKFIYLDKVDLNSIERELDVLLRNTGFIYREKTDEAIYNQILDNNKLSQVYKLKNLFYECISEIKENAQRDHYIDITKNYIFSLPKNEQKSAIKQFTFINEFYAFYTRQLYNIDTYGFEYADLIHYANKYILEKDFINDYKYDYVIIDEYQDISDGEYTLARKITDRHKSKVFAVGDDWQSIYSFRGSKIRYITGFDKYFENPTILSIRTTYRYSQELGDIAGKFIMENPDQIQKEIISVKHLQKPIHFIPFDGIDKEDSEVNAYKTLKELIYKIHEIRPDHKILILSRTNLGIEKCFKYDSAFKDDIGTKIRLDSIEDAVIDGMTIHKSKGLTYDEVIIIGMNNNFPMNDREDYWLISLFKPEKVNENIPYAEERRLLYVALTRTRNNVFILANKNSKNRSSFIDELTNINKLNNN